MALSLSRQWLTVSLPIESLECPVCGDVFEQPKVLPCSHYVCKKCLQDKTRNDQQFLECPICRVKSNLPPGGVDQLPTNRHVEDRINSIPGMREKQALSKAVQVCEENIALSESEREKHKKSIQTYYNTVKANAKHVKNEIIVHANNFVGSIQQQAVRKLCSEVDCALMENNFCISKLTNSVYAKVLDDGVNYVKFLLKRNNPQEIIETTEKALCMLKELNNSIVSNILFARSTCGSIKYLRFEKATEDAATGENIFGNLSYLGPNTNESTLAKEPEYIPIFTSSRVSEPNANTSIQPYIVQVDPRFIPNNTAMHTSYSTVSPNANTYIQHYVGQVDPRFIPNNTAMHTSYSTVPPNANTYIQPFGQVNPGFIFPNNANPYMQPIGQVNPRFSSMPYGFYSRYPGSLNNMYLS